MPPARRKAIGAREVPMAKPPAPADAAPKATAAAPAPAIAQPRVKVAVPLKAPPVKAAEPEPEPLSLDHLKPAFTVPPHIFLAFNVVAVGFAVMVTSFLVSMIPLHGNEPYFPRGNWNRHPERHRDSATGSPTLLDANVFDEQVRRIEYACCTSCYPIGPGGNKMSVSQRVIRQAEPMPQPLLLKPAFCECAAMLGVHVGAVWRAREAGGPLVSKRRGL
eukprot:6173799-Pleurochrysis_carterae.AAC.1